MTLGTGMDINCGQKAPKWTVSAVSTISDEQLIKVPYQPSYLSENEIT